MHAARQRRLILFLVFGGLAATVLIVFGLVRLLSGRAEVEDDLLRRRSLLAAWSADALADELERCRRAIVERAESSRAAGCAGAEEGASPFHWFVMDDPARATDGPPPEKQEQTLRQGFRQGCGEGAAPACRDLAERMVAAEGWADPLLAHHAPRVLRGLEESLPQAEVTFRLRRRLERILFEDSVRRHYHQLAPLFRPARPGEESRSWLQLGRYRLAGMEGGGRVLGFDSQPRPGEVRDFLLARNLLEGNRHGFDLRLHGEPPRHDARTASVAFVDERVGFLLVEDTDFADRLSEARRGSDRMLLWFSLAGIVLLASLALAWRTARSAMENVRLRENFVASVSHEFRSPLGSLELMIETLLEGKVESEPRRREYLEQMQREARRLSRLAENLLALGRIQRTRRLRPGTWSPGHAVEVAVEQVRGEAATRNIEIATTVEAALPERAGDADLIQMALMNLIDNAVKFSPPGSRVDVGASIDDGAVRFTVQDRGPGIPAREQKRIFDWFYRPGDEGNRETKGTGLGLAIVREVAARHGGTVEVHSRPGSGTRFDLRIPLGGTEPEGPADAR